MDFGIDILACRENLEAREKQRFVEHEKRRLAAHADVLAGIRQVLRGHPEVVRIYLFGSVIRDGDFHPGSDVDVAVEGTNAEQYFFLWRDLENASPGWFIDLREIYTPSYFSDSVHQRGELVYERENEGFTSQVSK